MDRIRLATQGYARIKECYDMYTWCSVLLAADAKSWGPAAGLWWVSTPRDQQDTKKRSAMSADGSNPHKAMSQGRLA